MSHIISSRNLYIDTTSGAGRGDDFSLELAANRILAADGQFLRLSLVNFSMYNNTYTVNRTNNSFRVVSRYGANGTLTQQNGISTLKSIPRGNYRTCGDIAQAFSEVVRATVEADARTATGDNTLTAVVTGVSGPNVEPSPNHGFSIGDRLLKFKITTSVPHTLTSIKLSVWKDLVRASPCLVETDLGMNLSLAHLSLAY